MKDKIFIDYLLVYIEKKIIEKLVWTQVLIFYFHDI